MGTSDALSNKLLLKPADGSLYVRINNLPGG